MLKHAIAYEGCTDTVRESALKIDSGRKIPRRIGESNLPQRRADSTLYQLSYISSSYLLEFVFDIFQFRTALFSDLVLGARHSHQLLLGRLSTQPSLFLQLLSNTQTVVDQRD